MLLYGTQSAVYLKLIPVIWLGLSSGLRVLQARLMLPRGLHGLPAVLPPFGLVFELALQLA